MGPSRPAAVNECSHQIIPSLILLFDGLKRAYAAKVADGDDDGNDDEETDIDEGDFFLKYLLIRFKIFLCKLLLNVYPFFI